MNKRQKIVRGLVAVLLLGLVSTLTAKTATAIPTPTATPTPFPNCRQGEGGANGVTWCHPNSPPTKQWQTLFSGPLDPGGSTIPSAPVYGSIDKDPLTVYGLLGGLTSTAGATLLQQCTIVTNVGTFSLLTITTDLNGSTCSTAPTYSLYNVTQTSSTGATALTGSTSAGQVTQSEALPASAGDQVCLIRTINGGTCTVPYFGVVAHFTTP